MGDLDQLSRSKGFRLRGDQMTRIETFTDAAFAFALTLLVISIDSIPNSVAQLQNLIRGIPAFLFSFALLMWFWHAHHIWSKRYGLDDIPTVWLSAALVFCILVFVYPLKFLYVIMVAWFSDGALVTALEPLTQTDLRDAFVIYGIGFCVTSLVLVLHYVYAWSQRRSLQLNARECLITRHSIVEWCIPLVLGLTSIGIAVFSPLGSPWAGMVYGLLGVLMPIHGHLSSKQQERLKDSESPANPFGPGSP